MKEPIITGNTFRTKDYSVFQRLEGNRSVLSSRVNKILRSINEVGYVFNPIIVNELFQIIDGQGRFEACKILGLPIDYVIADGARLEECIALNSSFTKWTIPDYIESWCELKNDHYIKLRQLMNEFPNITDQVKMAVISGKANAPTEDVRRGEFTFIKGQYESAESDLKFLDPLYTTLRKTTGGGRHYAYAITFARHVGADDDRLSSSISRANLKSAGSDREALDAVSDCYNWRLHDQDKRIYLYALFEKTNSKKFGWYNPNWGSNLKQNPSEESVDN